MAKKNRSQFAIMGILALSPNISGYDIRREMEQSTDFFWKESFSSIYPVLAMLEKEGMIVKQEDHTRGKRPRHLYSLSNMGYLALQEWLKEAPQPQQARSEILLKLFLGSLTTPVISLTHVQEYQRGLAAKKKTLAKILNELLAMPKETTGLPYWQLTIDHGMKSIDASLQWCEEALIKLKQIEEE